MTLACNHSQVAIGEAPLRSPQTEPRRAPAAMLDRSVHLPCEGGNGIVYGRCWFHEPGFGGGAPECASVAVLKSLEGDLADVMRRVEEMRTLKPSTAWMPRRVRRLGNPFTTKHSTRYSNRVRVVISRAASTVH